MSNVGGFSLWGAAFLTTLVFLVLKLTAVITWSWWWIFSPLLIAAGITAVVLVVIGLILLLILLAALKD